MSFQGPPGKKSRHQLEEQEDRISLLPDDILLEILSLLPTLQVMKMSSLARRWRYLWTLLPDINFIFHKPSISPIARELHLTVFNQITFALLFHRRQNLSRFIISLDGIPVSNPSHVYAWCRFAVERETDELQLNITGKPYVLPALLYNHRRLKSLFIRNCETKLTENPVCWPVLRRLKLQDSKLGGGSFEAILNGCPLLECLILENVVGGSTSGSLISAPRLRDLTVMETSLPVRLLAPNLVSLNISGSSNRLLHIIKDMHSLVRAAFSIKMQQPGGYQQGWGSSTGKCLSGLLDSACRAQFLTICRCCIEIFAAREINKLPSSILDVRSLVVKTTFSDSEIPGLRNLLRCSPDLETLFVEINVRSLCSRRGAFKMQKGFDGSPYLQPEEYALLSLRFVEIHEIIDIYENYHKHVTEVLRLDGILDAPYQKAYAKLSKERFVARSKFRKHMLHALHFIKFLLGSSVILEKITIWLPKKLLSTANSGHYMSFLKMIHFIGSFPRANATKVLCDYK